MTNYAIARIFGRIADLMEIKGENPFKIRAYRNAAGNLQELTESLEVLAERGDLREIPGVGEAIADKTREILATGTCKVYEDLRREVPESLAELLKLPGFGPRKIQSAWRELGVVDLESLEQAAREHRLQTLPALGAKTEEKLLHAIEGHHRRRERTPLFIALPYADALARALAATHPFQRVEVAGSVRRMQDTIGDIDLVAITTDPEAAVEAFCTVSEVAEVVERGPRGASVRTREGYRVDLRLGPPEQFASLLHHFTGSAAHNIHLRRLASQRGARLNEYGIFSSDGSESSEPSAQAGDAGMPLKIISDEADIYRFLGLPWIPPELREDWGEIQAAAGGALPSLIEERDYRGVLHAHSTWTDGAASIERMAETARGLGYAYHACTDHSRALAMARGLDPVRLREQMQEIDRLNALEEGEFRILKGIECDILADGTMDLPVELLAELDVVVASIHSRHQQDREAMTRRIVRALETGVVDILAHPTGRLLGARDPYEVDLERVFDAAEQFQVALEINAYPDRLDLDDLNARRARDRGLLLSLNPDAHRPEHLSMLRLGMAQARRAWLAPEQVLNTWPLDRLQAWLQGRTGR
jgi:DNA polymerase (family X)